MSDSTVKHSPIEITTHNIYFHEDSPVLSIDLYNGVLATCGFDGAVRLWKPEYKEMTYEESVYKTASNSTIRIEYIKDHGGFTKPINCARFCQSPGIHSYVLAACSDGGKIMLFTEQRSFIVQNDVGDDAYDMCWDETCLFVGFGSGTVCCYRIFLDNTTVEEPTYENADNSLEKESKKYVIRSELVFSQVIHSSTIQGIAYNRKYNLLGTFSLDNTVKVNIVNEKELVLVSTLNQKIDNSRGLFKRILFEDDSLYIFTKKDSLCLFSYPFKQIHMQKMIGPMNSSVVKVIKGKIKDEDVLFICTKKSVYVLKNDKVLYSIDNACYMAITDAVFNNNTLFLSSMDGFVSTIRHR